MRHLTGLNFRVARGRKQPLGPVNDTVLPDAALNFSAASLCLRYPFVSR